MAGKKGQNEGRPIHIGPLADEEELLGVMLKAFILRPREAGDESRVGLEPPNSPVHIAENGKRKVLKRRKKQTRKRR